MSLDFLASPDMLSFIVFIIILAAVIIIDRKKVKFQGFVFMRRTKKANNFINKIAKNHRSFWTVLAYAAVVTGIGAMILGSGYLIMSAFDIATGKVQTGGAGVVLPGPVSQPVAVPGVFIIPWWIWVIGVFFVMVPHEFMHGIMFRLHKIRIKSVGWILFIILPGAFVEPDERQLKRARRHIKLKAFAAGSFANFLVALIIAVVVSVAIFAAPATQSSGLYFQRINGTPADLANMTGILVSIDGTPIKLQNDLTNALSGKKPGDVVTVKTLRFDDLRPNFDGRFDFVIPHATLTAKLGDENVYAVKLTEREDNPDKAFLGVANIIEVTTSQNLLWLQLVNLLVWIYVFSFGIGLINMLPLKPLDGGLLYEEIVGRFTKRTKWIVRVTGIIMLVVLLFNIFGTFIV